MKTYIQPTTTVVRIQHQGLLMQSILGLSSNLTGDDVIIYDGASSNNTDGIVRTKESGSIWDEEW